MHSLVIALAGLASTLLAGAAFSQAYRWRTERLYPPVGHFIDIEGCRLHYLDAGPTNAEPQGTVVILHGAASNLVESMLGLGSKLAERYRVIVFDRPGHGWSERPAGIEAADPARQAAMVAEALRRLQVRDAVVVGHSWSGLVVPHFGLDHTDVAGALLVISGVTSPWPGGYMGWYRKLAASWFGWLFTRTIAVPISLVLRPLAARKTFRPEVRPPGFLRSAFIPLAFRPHTFHVNLLDFAVMREAVLRQSPRYREIRLPVVVAGGDMDEVVWTDLHSRSLARDIPGAELIIVENAGHMPHYAGQALFLSKIDALADRVASAGARAG